MGSNPSSPAIKRPDPENGSGLKLCFGKIFRKGKFKLADFNHLLDPGDWQNSQVNAVIEIPKGSSMKIEWDRDRAAFKVDRVEPAIFAKPVNYGFIPQTLDHDGDELDVLVVTDDPIPTNVWLKSRIIGVLNFKDENGVDHKIVTVPLDDRHTDDSIRSLEDLGEHWKRQIEHHFEHYKDLKTGSKTEVWGWGDVDEAKKIISECAERFKHNLKA